jgi:hypothetical protein
MQYPKDVLLAMHEVLHHFILTSVSFLHCTIAGCTRGTSGQGSGGTSMPSGITTTVHNPIAQSKPAIN